MHDARGQGMARSCRILELASITSRFQRIVGALGVVGALGACSAEPPVEIPLDPGSKEDRSEVDDTVAGSQEEAKVVGTGAATASTPPPAESAPPPPPKDDRLCGKEPCGAGYVCCKQRRGPDQCQLAATKCRDDD